MVSPAVPTAEGTALIVNGDGPADLVLLLGRLVDIGETEAPGLKSKLPTESARGMPAL
jgi:hypothetical protein